MSYRNSLSSLVLTYDIRGCYGHELYDDHAYELGLSLGSSMSVIVVGRDDRNSSSALESALIKGIVDSGSDAVSLGVVTTPMVHFALKNYQAGGVMITASHNADHYNGFKIIDSSGIACDGNAILQLLSKPKKMGSGKIVSANIDGEYRDSLRMRCTEGVAFFASNTATARILACVMNCQDIPQYMTDNHCKIGFIFDSDGDRVTVIDSAGAIVDNDSIMKTFVFNAIVHKKINFLLDYQFPRKSIREIESYGGLVKMVRPGHSIIKQLFSTGAYDMACEISGHFYFSELGYDDGLYAAFRLLDLLPDNPMPAIVATNPYKLIRLPILGCPKTNLMHILDNIINIFPNCAIFDNLDHMLLDVTGNTGDIENIILRCSGTEKAVICRAEGVMSIETIDHITKYIT